jgi:tRNA pseudouridine38/39 synthase
MRPWFRDRFLRSTSFFGTTSMAQPMSYENWTREELIERVINLERKAAAREPPKSSKETKPFDFSAHPTRKIALRFCYSGWAYNGLAFQNTPTPLPTVEETLFNALAQVRLVDDAKGLDGCGWERCGRTDRGVSAAGQVVSLRVRSALKSLESTPEVTNENTVTEADDSISSDLVGDFPSMDITPPSTPPGNFKTLGSEPTELRYVPLLNRVLPPTLRVLAWSPVDDSFSARFNCRSRHYKYFFTRTLPDGILDIDAMNEAARQLVGDHDFRNLCKLDPTKQITNFHRNVLRAEISPVDGLPDMFVLDLVGSAFLYHQVRHIMAVLLLVGSGLERPEVITALLNADASQPESTSLPIINRKPEYQMADGLPLMLWDCTYPDNDLKWLADGNEENSLASKVGGTGWELYSQLHGIQAHSTIHAALDMHFLKSAARIHPPPPVVFPYSVNSENSESLNIPLGAGTTKRIGRDKYIALLERKRLETVEVMNAKWLKKKNMKKGEDGGIEADAGDE